MEFTNIYKKDSPFKSIAKIILFAIFWAVALTFLLSLVLGCEYYIVMTGSMTPTLPVHTMVMVDPNVKYEDLQIGDIITYGSTTKGSGITYTHRVVDRTDDGVVITKGDADKRLEEVVKDRYLGRFICQNWLIGQIVIMAKQNLLICVAIIAIFFIWYAFS